MSLLDVGCGPGSITLGLAQVVAPGHVTGINHDWEHLEAAKARAAKQGATNMTFQLGDAFALPFEEGTVDAAFENNMFTHLAQNSIQAASDVYRVLKPGGFLAARDVDASAVVWGNFTEPL